MLPSSQRFGHGQLRNLLNQRPFAKAACTHRPDRVRLVVLWHGPKSPHRRRATRVSSLLHPPARECTGHAASRCGPFQRRSADDLPLARRCAPAEQNRSGRFPHLAAWLVNGTLVRFRCTLLKITRPWSTMRRDESSYERPRKAADRSMLILQLGQVIANLLLSTR